MLGQWRAPRDKMCVRKKVVFEYSVQAQMSSCTCESYTLLASSRTGVHKHITQYIRRSDGEAKRLRLMGDELVTRRVAILVI